ncbi:MAG: hypothetical protein ACSHWZ_18975 [Sulfitobacter sp.]
MINLVLSDRVGDAAVGTPQRPVAYTGTQIGLDPTTFKDALNVLERYNLLESAPAPLLAHLRNSLPSDETPSEPLPNVSNFVIQGLEDACAVALKVAQDKGTQTSIQR